MTLVGIGYRHEIRTFIHANTPPIEALEITVDHCIKGSLDHQRVFATLPDRYPIFLHGVGLSLGTAVRPDRGYLAEVREWARRLRVPWYSEHLAFTGVPGLDLAQLLPLPRTEDTLRVACENVQYVQDQVGLPLILENITYYFDYADSEISPGEFLAELCRRTGAGILLDLENVRINAKNHGYETDAFLSILPPRAVRAIHLAGGCSEQGLAIDTHDHPVSAATFALFTDALSRYRPDVVIVERDQGFEEFGEVLADLEHARQIRDEIGDRAPTPLAELPAAVVASPPAEPPARHALLDRQTEILRYLANPTAFAKKPPGEGAPAGADAAHLALLGGLILAKRWRKIESVLPATCRCIDAHAQQLIEQFAVAHPPVSLGRRENARQLHEFLVEPGAHIEPEYLLDLVRLELVIAATTFMSRERERTSRPGPTLASDWRSIDIRATGGLTVLETAYDLRAVIDGATPAGLERGPARHVAVVPGGDAARVFWLDRDTSELLLTLTEWTTVQADDSEDVARLVHSLARHELIEVRSCESV
jgi:uncharacterized protein